MRCDHKDHARFSGKALLASAERHCAGNGHRLTEPRRRVLEIVAAARKPAGAYDIIALMPKGTKPPTVYRALEFWEAEGFVHRISSLNVYAACHAGHRHDGSQYMICGSCGGIEEAHLCKLPEALDTTATHLGFRLDHWNAELHGTCAKCAAR